MSKSDREMYMVEYMRKRLDTTIREAFAQYLADCRRQVRADDQREALDQDVKSVARLLQLREAQKKAQVQATRQTTKQTLDKR